MDALDPYAKRLLDMLALRSGDVASLTIPERRVAFANLMRFCAPGPDIGGVENLVAQPAIRIYRPKGEPLAALLYFHGGGLVAGSLDTHDALCRTLAAATHCSIFAVDYRLAPEHPFPAALEDALAALTWIFARAGDDAIDRIGIGGDSAGGTLAAAAAAQWRARDAQKLCFQLLLCPILDFVAKTSSRRAFASPILDQAMLDHDIALYTASKITVADPRISPFRAANLSGLPPTFLHTAQCDPLRDEGAAYAERLRAAQIETHYTCHAGMPHLFYALSGVIPAAKEAVAKIGAELAGWLPQKTL